MAEIATRVPLSLDDIMSIAAGKQVNAAVEPVTIEIIEKTTATEGRERYLLSADFHFQIDGESYLVSIPYTMGEHDEPPEVATAVRKIANSRLRRDCGRLHQAGIEMEPRYFEEV